MLKAADIPTPLVAERDPVPIVDLRPERGFPVVGISVRLLWWVVTILWLRLTRQAGAAEFRAPLPPPPRRPPAASGSSSVSCCHCASISFPIRVLPRAGAAAVSVTGFRAAEAVAILEADLGRPLDVLFSEFSLAPIAAASMGQVHVARLRTSGVRVAVKVQRPQLPAVFAHQLKVIAGIVWVLKRLHYRPNLRWDELIWELTEIMKEEMDCRYEASTTRRMRRTLRAHGIYAPRVFYATARVLVTEFIDGVLMTDYLHAINRDPARVQTWLAENGIDPGEVGRRLIRSLLRQILEDNLFHGDLHPGNIMLLRGNRIALIDFGACSFTEREYLERFRVTVRSLADGTFEKAADLTLLLCGPLPRVDLESITESFVQAMRIWAAKTGVAGVPYHEKSVAVIYNEVIRILYEHDCTMEWALLRIRRAQETLDASLLYLVPDVNYRTLARGYFRAAERRAAAMQPGDAERAGRGASLDAALSTIAQIDEYTLLNAATIRRQARRFEAAAEHIGDLFASSVARLATVGAVLPALVVGLFLGTARSRGGRRPHRSCRRGMAAARPRPRRTHVDHRIDGERRRRHVAAPPALPLAARRRAARSDRLPVTRRARADGIRRSRSC